MSSRATPPAERPTPSSGAAATPGPAGSAAGSAAGAAAAQGPGPISSTSQPSGKPLSTFGWRRRASQLIRSLKASPRAIGRAVAAAVRHRCWGWLARWLLRIGATLAAVAAVLFLLMRFVLWPQAAGARVWLEERGSQALSGHLTIAALETSWDGWHPAFLARGVRLVDDQQRVLLSADTLQGAVSWHSLGALELRFARFDADHADVLVHRSAQGRLEVAGMPVRTQDSSGDDHRFLDWLLAQGSVTLTGGKVRWLDEQRGLPVLEVGDILLRSTRSGARHDLRLEARSAALAARPLVVTGTFRHTYLHAPGDWRNWRGQASWDIGQLQLPAVQRYLSLFERVDSGVLSSDGTIEFANGELLRSQARLRANAVDLRLAGAAEPLRLNQSQALLLHRREGADNQLTVDTLLWEPAGAQAQANGGAWREGMRRVTLRWARDDNGALRRLALKAPTLDLDALRALSTAMPLDTELARQVRALRPSGRLDNLDIHWTRERGGLLQRQGGPTRYRVQGTLRNVSVREQPAEPPFDKDGHANLGVPGFSGLSGNFSFDQQGGSARFEGAQATLTFPGVFEDPRLPFDELAGAVQWRREAGKLVVLTDGIRFANADTAGTVRGSWREGGDGHAGIAELDGELGRAQIARVPRYLPLHVPASTRHYLAGALAGGESEAVRFQVKGDLAHFPFHGDAARHGDFRVDVPLRQASYQIDPHGPDGKPLWPLFTEIDGSLQFERGAMALTVERASVQGLPGVALRDIKGRIDELDHRGRLTLDGSASGPMQGFLRYIASSPVREWTGNFTGEARGQGNGELRLKLDLPLADATHSKVEGQYRLTGNDVVLAPGLPMLGGATGTVAFNEHGFQLDAVRARLLGGEVRASGGTQSDGTVRVTAAGSANSRGIAEALASAGLSPLARRFDGNASYQAVIGVRERQPVISFTADLAGMAVDLPAPLAKPAGQSAPLRFELRPLAGRAGHEELELQYGAMLNARYLLRRGAGGVEVINGGIGIGQPAPTPATGVTAALAGERFDLDGWRAALASGAPNGPTNGPANGPTNDRGGGAREPVMASYLPERITARSRTLLAFGRELDDVTLDAVRAPQSGDPGWQFRLESRQIAGQMQWRAVPSSPGGALTLRLSRLNIPDSQDTSKVADALAGQIEELPSIDLQAEQFELRGHDFGKLQVKAHSALDNGEPVWTLESLTLEQPGATFTGQGSWRVPRRVRDSGKAGGQRRTLLSFNVDVRNAGDVLDRLGMPHTLRDGKGKLEGRIRWIGSPLAIDYASLNGRMALKLENGQILSVEPGAAKLLGVLSLQSVMRLVTLDFRGIAGQGLVFDEISATGTIENGIASTSDFRLKSPQVSAAMTGSANLPQETQDLEVALVPRINATSASVAAAFINPVLGIGTLAAQLLFADEFSKAFTQHYKVTGSWAEPRIAKVGDNNVDGQRRAPDRRQPEQSYMP